MIADDDIVRIFELLEISVINITRINTFANILFKVKTNKGNYFLKFYEAGDATGKKLASLYSLLLDKKIPVPKVIKYDDSSEVVKCTYLITAEVEGQMLCDMTMSDSEKEFLYYDFGKIVSKIHSITFDIFGDTFDGKTVEASAEANNTGPFNTWKDMHREIINYRLRILENSVFADLIEPISAWFDKYSYLIDYDIVPRLLHIDLNKKNVFVKNNMVSGIIDFDDAFIGHNEEELMRIEIAHGTDVLPAFLKGYTESVALDEEYAARKKYYYFSRLLVHIGCMIKFGGDYADSEEVKIVREEVSKLLAN